MSIYNPGRSKNRKAARINKKEERERLREAERLRKEAERKEKEEKEKLERERIKKLGRKKDRKGKRLKRKKILEVPVIKEPEKRKPEKKHPKKIHSVRYEREKRKEYYKKPRPVKIKKSVTEKTKKPVRENIKKPVREKEFDYDRVYTIPGKYYMSISYRDLTCEKSLNQILSKYGKMSNKELIKSLKRIVNRRGNFDYDLYKSSGGKEGTSNGVAGKANFRLGNIIDIQSDRYKQRNETETGRKRNEKRISQGKKPLFTHEGKYDYYQDVTSKGSPFIKTFTPRNLLVLFTGIMNNITEVEREDFWNSVIHEFSIIMPEVLEFLPH